MIDQTIYDITIIGGGPVGLFAAFYAGLRHTKVKLIESLMNLGGQPSHLYAEKYIYDIPAHPKVTGERLGHLLTEQLNLFDPTICLGEEVTMIHPLDDGTFKLETSKGIHYSRSIILAVGSGAFSPRRIKLDDASSYEGHSLHYFVKDLNSFQDQVVAVAGGGDSAVDWALALEAVASKVYLIHRRQKFRALEHSVHQLQQSTVEILTPYNPSKLIGDGTQLTHLELNKARTDEFIQVPVDHLIINYGFSSHLGPVRNWGLSLSQQSIEVNSLMETSIPGIFAIGDIAQYPGKAKLIATGFGEAPLAVNEAINYANPEGATPYIHSTSLF